MRMPRLLVALACLLLLAGCSGLAGTDGKGYIAGSNQVVQYAVADRGEPVVLSGTSLDGEAIDIADWAGQPVVINVWWSGCVPCRTEMPMLVQAAADLDGTAQFLGINTRDYSADQGIAFTREKGVTYPSLFEPAGKALLAFHGAVSPRYIPTTVVLDAEHRVAAVVLGEIPSQLTLTQLVEEVAAEHG